MLLKTNAYFKFFKNNKCSELKILESVYFSVLLKFFWGQSVCWFDTIKTFFGKMISLDWLYSFWVE